jgi:hypothetical protein
MKKILLAITFLTLGIINGFTQTKDDKCLILHKGTFSYGKKGNIIVINGNTLTEYNGNYIIKKNIVWVNDCEYNTVVTKTIRPKRYKRKVNGYYRGTIIWDRARNAGYDYIPKPKKMGYQKLTNKPRNIEKVGYVLNVKINDVIDNIILYTASRNSKSWQGILIKKNERRKK